MVTHVYGYYGYHILGDCEIMVIYSTGSTNILQHHGYPCFNSNNQDWSIYGHTCIWLLWWDIFLEFLVMEL